MRTPLSLASLTSLLLAARAAAESLDAVRSELGALQSAIVHSVLARAALPVSASARADEAAAVRSAFAASELTAPLPFLGSPPYPFVSLARTPDVAQRWGDTGHGNRSAVSLLAHYYEALNATARNVPPPIAGAVPLAAQASAQVLVLCAARIAKGRNVALAKLRAAPQTFCPLLAASDAERNASAIRAALTVPAQEAAVLAAVGAQAALWSSAANVSAPLEAPRVNASTPPAAVPERVQQLFSDYMIPTTTDYEVYTLLALPRNTLADLDCAQMH